MRNKIIFIGTTALLGISWYYAIYIPWPGLMTHTRFEGEPPDYYLGLYDRELMVLMVLTAIVCGLVFRRQLRSAESKDWLKWATALTGSGILIFSVSIVLYAFALQIAGVNRPDELQLYYPTLFSPEPAHFKLITLLLAPIGGLWFSFLSYYTVVPMAIITQWLMRKVAV